jgi:hypothetical protein
MTPRSQPPRLTDGSPGGSYYWDQVRAMRHDPRDLWYVPLAACSSRAHCTTWHAVLASAHLSGSLSNSEAVTLLTLHCHVVLVPMRIPLKLAGGDMYKLRTRGVIMSQNVMLRSYNSVTLHMCVLQVSMRFTLKMAGGDVYELRTEAVLYITPRLAMSVEDFYAQKASSYCYCYCCRFCVLNLPGGVLCCSTALQGGVKSPYEALVGS